MLLGIFVVLHEAGLGRVDRVVATHSAVFAREPVGAALAEDDIAWDNILLYSTSISSLYLVR